MDCPFGVHTPCMHEDLIISYKKGSKDCYTFPRDICQLCVLAKQAREISEIRRIMYELRLKKW